MVLNAGRNNWNSNLADFNGSNFTTSSHRRCSINKDVFKISQYSQRNTCARVALQAATLLKKRLSHRVFSMNFARFLRAAFLHNTSG